MICVTALYPNNAGSRFDANYYCAQHAAFAKKLLTPHGLISVRITLGISDLAGAPPPFWAVSEMIFESRAAFDAAMGACGGQLLADANNYTDAMPVMQLSELRAGRID